MTEEQKDAFVCERCKQSNPRLDFQPWPGELGLRLQNSICQQCWGEWMQMQTKIINEYRINVLHPEHAKAVRDQMEIFLGFKEPPAERE